MKKRYVLPAEIVLFGGGFAFVNYLSMPENVGMIGVSPHPLLFIIMAFSLRYTRQVSFAITLLGVLAHQVLFVYSPFTLDVYSLFTLENLFMVASFFFVGFFLSQKNYVFLDFTSFLKRQVEREKSKMLKVKRTLDLQTNINKELQARLKSRVHTYSNIYRISSYMQSTNPIDVLGGFLDSLNEFLKAKEVGYYRVESGELVLERGRRTEYPYPKKLSAEEALIKKTLESKEVEWKLDAESEERRGKVVIAAALCNELGEVEGVFCVFEIPFMELYQENLDTFKLLLRWLNMSYIKSRKWKDLEKQALFIPSKKVYTHQYLNTLVDRSIANFTRYQTSFSLAVIELRVSSNVDFEMVELLAIRGMYTLLRTGDLIAEGRKSEEFCVFLPSTGEEGAQICAEKLAEVIERQFNPEVLQYVKIVFGSGEIRAEDKDTQLMLSRIRSVG